jgi:hypothetical protein
MREQEMQVFGELTARQRLAAFLAVSFHSNEVPPSPASITTVGVPMPSHRSLR